MPIKEAIIINNLSVPRIKFNQSRIISLSSVKKKKVVTYLIITKNFLKLLEFKDQGRNSASTGNLTQTNNSGTSIGAAHKK